jgi:HEPN domain-containing protein
MTKEQKFKKEYASELLAIAEGDLETTRILFNASSGRPENVCFNAQQVIEKSLKAVLCHNEIPVPFTHNLDILIDRLPSHLKFEGSENINDLTEYATIRRYEEGTFILDKEDLQTAFELAKQTFLWAKNSCRVEQLSEDQ